MLLHEFASTDQETKRGVTQVFKNIPNHSLCDLHTILRGGGQTFFRAFINSELGLPEVAPCMAGTFGGVSGHRRRTGSEPHPAQIWSQK